MDCKESVKCIKFLLHSYKYINIITFKLLYQSKYFRNITRSVSGEPAAPGVWPLGNISSALQRVAHARHANINLSNWWATAGAPAPATLRTNRITDSSECLIYFPLLKFVFQSYILGCVKEKISWKKKAKFYYRVQQIIRTVSKSERPSYVNTLFIYTRNVYSLCGLFAYYSN